MCNERDPEPVAPRSARRSRRTRIGAAGPMLLLALSIAAAQQQAAEDLLDALRSTDGDAYLKARVEAARSLPALEAYAESLRKKGALTLDDSLLVTFVKAWHENTEAPLFYTHRWILKAFWEDRRFSGLDLEEKVAASARGVCAWGDVPRGVRWPARERAPFNDARHDLFVILSAERVLKSFSCELWRKAIDEAAEQALKDGKVPAPGEAFVKELADLKRQEITLWRGIAVHYLASGRWRDDIELGLLLRVLQRDPIPGIRLRAAKELGRVLYVNRRVEPALIRSLQNDESVDVRAQCLLGFEDAATARGHAEALSVIIEAEDRNSFLAIRLLAHYTRKAIEAREAEAARIRREAEEEHEAKPGPKLRPQIPPLPEEEWDPQYRATPKQGDR